MLYLTLKALISGILIAAASEIAKRYPGIGALVASLPLVSVLGMIWLWRDKPDPRTMAAHAGATFWYVLPSLPMFLLIPAMLRHGAPFWMSLVAGCVLTIALYAAMTWAAPKLGMSCSSSALIKRKSAPPRRNTTPAKAGAQLERSQ